MFHAPALLLLLPALTPASPTEVSSYRSIGCRGKFGRCSPYVGWIELAIRSANICLVVQAGGVENSTAEELLVEVPEEGPGLGQILGLASLVVLMFYILGISWKLYKIHIGVYVEEEPVFLKYK